MNLTKTPRRALQSLRVGLALLALAVVGQGCAAAEPEDDTSSTEGAATVGGRFTSPLEPGVYDADDGILSITNWADRQYVSFVIPRNGENPISCWGMTADIKDGRVSVAKPECTLKLDVTSDRAVVAVSGKLTNEKGSKSYSAPYRRRAKDALVGSYAIDEVKLTVESSADAKVTYSLLLGDKTVASHATATVRTNGIFSPGGDEGFSFYGTTSGCPIRLSVTRSDRTFGIYVSKFGEATDLAQCPVATSIMAKQR